MLMSAVKTRDPRRKVLVKARMRAGERWSDVTVCNVSRRGMLLKIPDAPQRGEYVEIRCDTVCVIGRVVWSSAPNLGIRAQDDIDIAALLHERARSHPDQERRAVPRDARSAAPALTIEAQAERSRRIAHIINWSMLAVALACGAGVVGQVVHSTLSAPFEQSRDAMGSRNPA